MRWVRNLLLRLGIRRLLPMLYVVIAVLMTGAVGVALSYYLWSHPEGPVDLIENWGIDFERETFKSFLASWWQDWFFFILIGAPAALLFSINPAKEHFYARLGWLFTGRHKTAAVADHLIRVVRKHSAFARTAEAEVYLSAYDPDIQAYRASVTIRMTLCNLLQNEEYEDDIRVGMSGDETAPSDGVVGGISIFEIARSKVAGMRADPEHLSDELPVKLMIGQKNHCSAEGKIRIDADEFVYFTFSFWHWSKVGVPLTFGLDRFTEELTVTVHHDCSTSDGQLEIPFSLDHPEAEGRWNESGFEQKILQCNRVLTLGKYRNVGRGQRILMVFSAPRQRGRISLLSKKKSSLRKLESARNVNPLCTPTRRNYDAESVYENA